MWVCYNKILPGNTNVSYVDFSLPYLVPKGGRNREKVKI
jgi:hypothetical protein